MLHYCEGKRCSVNPLSEVIEYQAKIKFAEVKKMSKYSHLWNRIKENGSDRLKLTYAEIEKITGIPIDHSFLNYKKELTEYGYKVAKISMKEQTVLFEKQ